MAMWWYSSVIVNKIYVTHDALIQPKHDAPITGHAHAPKPFAVSCEGMEAVARNVYFVNRPCRVEQCQNFFDPWHHGGANAAPVSSFVKSFEPFVSKALDQAAL